MMQDGLPNDVLDDFDALAREKEVVSPLASLTFSSYHSAGMYGSTGKDLQLARGEGSERRLQIVCVRGM